MSESGKEELSKATSAVREIRPKVVTKVTETASETPQLKEESAELAEELRLLENRFGKSLFIPQTLVIT